MPSAPFRFAPTHRWVWFPDWGRLASHDVPFKDGLCGEIEIEITAVSPLLVGGARRPASDGLAGEVWPFETVDSSGTPQYVLPASSLQGLVRSLLEVAAFGKLAPNIENKRFGIRDLTPPARLYYQERLSPTTKQRGDILVSPAVRAGWLRRVGTGKDATYELKRCSYARLEYSDLEPLTGVRGWNSEGDAAQRYQRLRTEQLRCSLHIDDGERDPRHRHGPRHNLLIAYRKAHATRPENGATVEREGNVVLTGSPARSRKHMEFFFYDEKDAEVLEGFGDKFKEFLDIHAPEDGRGKNPNWQYFEATGYAGKPFKSGGWMPIFYLADSSDPAKIDTFGLAFMFKLAHKATTHELLANSHQDHLDDKRLDLASLIFGNAASEEAKGAAMGIKRRASFAPAVATLPDGKSLQTGNNNAVLLGPKPSYFPFYVRQPGEGVRLPTDQGNRAVPYATYTPLQGNGLSDEHKSPELSGVKIWPVTGQNLEHAQEPNAFRLPTIRDEKIARNQKIQTRLHALPAGTVFRNVRLRFHNLRPSELGALLWALTLGDEAALKGGLGEYRYRLGMGKPYGMGTISIAVKRISAIANTTQQPEHDNPDTRARILDAFVDEIDSAYRAAGGEGSWADSVQVKALRKAANSRANEDPGGLNYMPLGKNSHEPGTYLGTRFGGLHLSGYVIGHEFPRGGGSSVGHTSASTEGEIKKGARIRLETGSEGTIVDPKGADWLVLLDGRKKPTAYKSSHFKVIG